MTVLGKTQVAILRTVHGGDWFVAAAPSHQHACLRLHSQRLLARDPQQANRWTSNAAGDRAIEEHDDDLDRRSGWSGEPVAEQQRKAAYAGREDA